MKILKGTGIVPQIAQGSIYVYKQVDNSVEKRPITDATAEIQRYEQAKALAIAELKELYDRAVQDFGVVEAMIFEVHQMMLEDDDFDSDIKLTIVKKNANAEFAVETAKNTYANLFENMDNIYIRGRGQDVRDVADRVINLLKGNVNNLNFEKPVIVVANELKPSQTLQMDKDKVLAFVTTGGSKNSHTSILARMLGIPAIIAMDADIQHCHNMEAIVDGEAGVVYLSPTAEIECQLQEKAVAQKEKAIYLQALKGKPNVTKAGKTIDIFANIADPTDVSMVLEQDAGGIGLLRSEFLYLQAKDYPTEDDQFYAYKRVLQKMNGKKVIIRTLDIGSDKKADYFELPAEENPAMGYRAIRISLTKKDVFKTQLRAIYRASRFGNLSVMFPMIISVEEVIEIKQIVEEVKAELHAQDVIISDEVELGIMIETPAAVMISDLLAKEVDFFSIGTNDLSSYTLAIDRQNKNLVRFDKPHHVGVLRMIEMVTKNAKAAGIWVGICGELAADVSLTEYFLNLGIDELSVSPPYVLPLRDKVRSL